MERSYHLTRTDTDLWRLVIDALSTVSAVDERPWVHKFFHRYRRSSFADDVRRRRSGRGFSDDWIAERLSTTEPLMVTASHHPTGPEEPAWTVAVTAGTVTCVLLDNRCAARFLAFCGLIERQAVEDTMVETLLDVAPVEGMVEPEPGLSLDLTDAELAVAILLAAGLTHAEVAQRRCVATGTVKTQANRISAKIRALGYDIPQGQLGRILRELEIGSD